MQTSASLRRALYKIARALSGLGIMAEATRPEIQTPDVTGIDAEWFDLATRWRATSTLSKGTRADAAECCSSEAQLSSPFSMSSASGSARRPLLAAQTTRTRPRSDHAPAAPCGDPSPTWRSPTCTRTGWRTWLSAATSCGAGRWARWRRRCRPATAGTTAPGSGSSVRTCRGASWTRSRSYCSRATAASA